MTALLVAVLVLAYGIPLGDLALFLLRLRRWHRIADVREATGCACPALVDPRRGHTDTCPACTCGRRDRPASPHSVICPATYGPDPRWWRR